MTAQLAPTPIFKGIDNNGFPLAFGTLTTYAAGTTTPIATYVDSTQTTQNQNPIPLNFRGECNLWLDPTKAYKFLLQDFLGNTIPGWPVDNITIGNANPSYNIIPISDNLYTLGSPTFSWANVYVGANHAPVLDTVSGNIGYYARTAAEQAAGVTPTNYVYAPGDVLRYGADLTGVADSTTAFQRAINQHHQGGPAVYFRDGAYKITSTLSGFPGMKMYGDGWASNSGTFFPITGSSLNWYGSGTPVLSIPGPSLNNYYEAICLRDFAIVNQTGTNATGIKFANAPFSRLDNLYIANFGGSGSVGANGVGIEQGINCWQCCFTNVKILGCNTCLYAHDAGEDSTYTSCIFRSFNYSGGVGAYIANQCQTSTFLGCDLSDNLYGCQVAQGDTNGNGTGTPFPMHLNFIGCQFEQNAAFAIGVIVSNSSYASIKAYPSIITENCRFFIPGSGGSVTPNNGQALIYAQACSQIKMIAPQESGYSYGAIIGISQYGFTMSGTAKPGPVSFENDCYTYGTARFHASGLQGSNIVIPGDHAIARMSSAALNYVNPNNTLVPFTTIVSDAWNWYQSFITGLMPTKSQTVRFKAQVATASAAVGRYQLRLFKNGAGFLTIYDATVSTAGNPLVMTGEAVDVPSGPGYGTGDYYYIVVFAGANFTLDTANSYFTAEVVGE